MNSNAHSTDGTGKVGSLMPATAFRNRSLLQELVAEGHLDVTLGSLFERPAPYSAGQVPWERVQGMMLGLAIGDALGNTTEGLFPAERRRLYGEIREYLPHPYAKHEAVGLPSDDSQLAFWTVEHLVECDGLVPERLAHTFASRRIFGIGSAVRQFIAGMERRVPWWRASARSAGNGALMRIAPITIPHLRTADSALWSDAALCAAITHNDRGSIGACVAFVGMLAELLVCRRPPDADWWVERYVEIASEVEGAGRYGPRGGRLQHRFHGPIWRFAQEQVPPLVARKESVLQAGKTWYSGAYLLETVPTVLFILARYGEDPEEAIVRAVNDTKDNDTVAAIVGAAVGALHGEAAIPRHWRKALLGRTTANDDGRVFELLRQARIRFGSEVSTLDTQTASGDSGGPGTGTSQ